MNYIIFDLEATCWENNKNKRNEIIEIGAVKLNENLDIIDTFSEYVKPIINPMLSEFCKTLTSIRQSDIENAQIFSDAMDKFEKWILSGSDGNILILSWGYYDKKKILRESLEKGYWGGIIKLLEEKHVSLKHEFAKIKNIKPCGMSKALQILNLPLEGTHHRGIDDAKNIAKIFRQIFSILELSPTVKN